MQVSYCYLIFLLRVNIKSTRSGLSLIGTILVGRLSDRFGRAILLYIGTLASIFSFCCNIYGNSVTALYISIVPSALLNQNFSVLKALFSDYSSDNNASESERAASIGFLGMAVGLSFMIGYGILYCHMLLLF